MERHQASGRWRLGFTLACTTMLLWGSLPIALKVVLAQMDAVTITFYRFLGATLVVGTYLAVRGRLPQPGRLDRRGQTMLLGAGLFLGINYLMYLMGLDLTTPADAQVLLQFGPLLLAFGGLVVFRERFVRLQWLGATFLVLGLGLFFSSQLGAIGEDTQGREQYFLGNALMVGAAMFWASYGLLQKQLLRQLSSQHVMLCIYAGCALLFLPSAAITGLAMLDRVGLIALGYCTLNTAIGYGAFAEALEHWEASRVSAVLALTPFATLVLIDLGTWIWPTLDVDHRGLPWTSFAGAGLVVVGSLLTSLARER